MRFASCYHFAGENQGHSEMAITVEAAEHFAVSPDRLLGAQRTNAVDRWIFVFTVLGLIATVLAGFIPDSIAKIAAIDAGKRSPFPLILHVHAVMMGSFLLLLLAQTLLVATGRLIWHMQLGIAGLFLAAGIVVSGIILAHVSYHAGPAQDYILLLQIRAGLLFSIFTWIALKYRARDPGLHKRLMLLSITAVLDAAIFRIHWLPTTFPGNGVSLDLFTLLPFVPMFIWDSARNRSLHRAYVIWAALFVPATAVVYALWDSPWWHATAHQIMGV
jgi:hypothetical protein